MGLAFNEIEPSTLEEMTPMNCDSLVRDDRLFETRHWLLAGGYVLGALILFSPMRSQQAADSKAASQPLGTPAPLTRPNLADGASANAAGLASLAASRQN